MFGKCLKFVFETGLARKILASLVVLSAGQSALWAKPVIFQFASYYSENDTRLPDPSLVTHIIFSPVRINGDFSLNLKYPKMLEKISALKKENPKLKVMMLVGGGMSQNFSEAASSAESRAKLLDEFAAYMKKYNLDGIDLDWEFPTVSRPNGQTGKPEDVVNYTALMREFRGRFPDKILTVDVGNTIEFIDLAAADKYVDYFNLMSYDYSGIRHNAPLFISNFAKKRCVSNTVEELMKKVPSKKIVMGIPFYGHIFLKEDVGNPMLPYKSLGKTIKKMNLTPCRDEVARAPFYMDENRKIAAACEDPQSVAEKCAYAKLKSLAGVMCWQLLDDDEDLTLSRAVHAEMQKD